MVNHPWEHRLDTPLQYSYTILQTRAFNCKIVSIGVLNVKSFFLLIKTSGSELRGQEAASSAYSSKCDHYSELFTRMVGLNF